MLTDDAADWNLAAPAEFAKALLANRLRLAATAASPSSRVGHVTPGCLGGAAGSAISVLGNTKFACGVSASVVELSAAGAAAAAAGCHPLLAAGVVLNADLPPVCSRAFRPGPPSDLAQALTVQVSDALAQSGCLDAAQLTVGPRHRLQLHVDAVCLSADGSLPDACLLAVSAALANLCLPRLVVPADAGHDDSNSGPSVRSTAAADVGVRRCPSGEQFRPAVLRPGSAVICTSFVAIDNDQLLSVPDGREEALPGAAIVRVFTAGGGDLPVRVVSVQMVGEAASELVGRCCREAVERHAACLAGPLAR
ncbi:hypothetical protein BOX15_Mlig025093g2 [Macrostomum lignano]|uniref:Ribosomal RNA-processing protein 43 n=1 Tax=Macrostomum lignano TaxID=282301 RepID=A0A267G500_9PLAT|nr:hypothetical protein BOX15_Mlig025093g2 [Macrostomum lignano]